MAATRHAMTERHHKTLVVDVLKQFRLIYGSVRQQFRQVEEACGITGSQLWLLNEVSQAPGIGISDLALRLAIHQTTCSQLVEKLVNHGYLVKARSTADQRRVGLTLTRSARRALKDAPGPAEGILPEALMGLSAQTLKSLSGELAAVIAELKVADEKAAERPLADL